MKKKILREEVPAIEVASSASLEVLKKYRKIYLIYEPKQKYENIQ